MTSVVRQLGVENLDLIEALELKNSSDPWSCISDYFNNRAYKAFGIFHEESLVAWILVQIIDEESEVLQLLVDSAFRNRGLGNKLLTFVIKELKSLGAVKMFLEVRVSNLSARRLYERNSFQLVGQRAAYYKKPTEDALILELAID